MYVLQDMKQNNVKLGGGKTMAHDSCEPQTTFHLQSQAL